MPRNPRPDQIGTGGRMLSESLAGSPRNTHRYPFRRGNSSNSGRCRDDGGVLCGPHRGVRLLRQGAELDPLRQYQDRRSRIPGKGRRQRTRVFSELQMHYLFEDRFGRPGKDTTKQGRGFGRLAPVERPGADAASGELRGAQREAARRLPAAARRSLARSVTCFRQGDRRHGGWLSSDGGVVLLREIESRLGIAKRLAACLSDGRDPERVRRDHGLAPLHDIVGLYLSPRICRPKSTECSVPGTRVSRIESYAWPSADVIAGPSGAPRTGQVIGRGS